MGKDLIGILNKMRVPQKPNKLKVTYVLSKIDKAIAFEWIYNSLKDSIDFNFIFIGESKGQLYYWLKERGITVSFISYGGKKSLPKAFFLMLWFFIKSRPRVIHTHLFEANFIGLTAAKVVGISKRVYTRHHSTFHHEFYPKAIKWDKWCNKMATDVVAITKSVQSVLIDMEGVEPSKVSLIEHGFKLEGFRSVEGAKKILMLRKYQLPENRKIIGAISRYIEWKGVIYIIRAFKQLLEKNPDLHLVLANANGPDAKMVKKELEKLPIGSFTEIKFEEDLFTLYSLFEVFVHTPINSRIEAFGQTYVEALAAAVPSVFTLSGVANDFIVDRRNALVVEYKNEKQIERAITELLTNKELVEKIKINGLEDVKAFSLEIMIHKLNKLYLE